MGAQFEGASLRIDLPECANVVPRSRAFDDPGAPTSSLSRASRLQEALWPPEISPPVVEIAQTHPNRIKLAPFALLSTLSQPLVSTLSEKKFQKLASELRTLVESAQEAASTEKARGYWEIGRRIAKERLDEEAGYHNSILRDLAHATGISARTLQRSVAFHRAYETPPEDGLTWMHYQLLATVDVKSERTFYQKKTAVESWSVRDLGAAIRSDLYGGGSVEARVLARPKSLTYCYFARALRVVDGDTIDFDVDLGFRSWTKQRIRLAGVDAPDIKTPRGRAARNAVQKELTRAQTIVLKSERADLYGRYVADVFLAAHTTDLESCFESGRYLNDLLVREGHATVAP